MMKRIQPTETTFRLVRDTGSPLRLIDPAQVQQALGAEEVRAVRAEAVLGAGLLTPPDDGPKVSSS
jgi:hypothetical protein